MSICSSCHLAPVKTTMSGQGFRTDMSYMSVCPILSCFYSLQKGFRRHRVSRCQGSVDFSSQVLSKIIVDMSSEKIVKHYIAKESDVQRNLQLSAKTGGRRSIRGCNLIMKCAPTRITPRLRIEIDYGDFLICNHMLKELVRTS